MHFLCNLLWSFWWYSLLVMQLPTKTAVGSIMDTYEKQIKALQALGRIDSRSDYNALMVFLTRGNARISVLIPYEIMKESL